MAARAKPAAKARKAAKPKTSRARKPRAAPPELKAPDLYELGARVVSVFGAFDSRVLIEMPAKYAESLFPEPFHQSGLSNVVDGAEREIKAIRDRDKPLAEFALAASAVALAREIENPYNSATSKSMCAREMRDTLDRLRELVPPERQEDAIDRLARKRTRRRSRSAETTNKPGS